MDGLLVIDKPVGPTSHDVVMRVRRALGESRIGHTGTLDPLASGVLVLVLGRATRLAQFMTGDEKAYEARIRLGIDTDTFDATGRPVGPPFAGGWPGRETILDALEELRGTHRQQPPAFSAKKIDGRRSYALARQRVRSGEADESTTARLPEPTEVTLSRSTLLDYREGVLDLAIECSSGFYVRSLAHDLGARLGTGGHLEALRRTRSGGSTLGRAIPLASVEAAPGDALAALLPLSAMLPGLPAVVLTQTGGRRAAHGQRLGDDDVVGGLTDRHPVADLVRLLSADGTLVGIARPTTERGILHPSVVLM